jgi:two-component system, NarL family, sensor histidine kinase UhpB
LIRISYYITRTAAIIVITVGILVLWGWHINNISLKQVLPKMVAMNPMEAVSFILCGIAFLLHQQKGYKRILAITLASLVILIALLRIAAIIGLYDAGIDRLLFAEQLQSTIYNGTTNHIVPHAAVSFFICGTALLLLIHGRAITAQWMALPVNALSILSIIGYSYHISSYYVVTSFTPMSFHGGITFMFLSMTLLLAESTKGFMGEITNMHAGGKAARILLPALVAIPALLGYYILKGISKGNFSVVVWMSLFVCAVIFMFGLLVWATARFINKSEEKRLLEKQKADEERRQMTEYKIKQSQERYFTLMNSVDGIVWEADAQTFAFTFISKQAEQILGYPAERWVTEPTFWADHIIEEDRKWAVNFCAAATAQGKPHQFEYRMIAADGRILWLRDFVSVLMENRKPVKLSGIMVDITEQKKMEQELSEKERSKQKLITEITILAQEKERNELGLELHDNINQLLSVVKLYLGRAKTEKALSEEMIDKSYLHLEEAIRDIRKLSHSLVAPSLGHDGLKEALEDLTRSVQDLNKIDIRLLLDEDFELALQDKKKELMLYRIVQEQLTNIVKYANATEVVICLELQENNLTLMINDNGVGFDTQLQSNGIGLKNINSRVHFYAGKMSLTSAPGEGCTLEISVPKD